MSWSVVMATSVKHFQVRVAHQDVYIRPRQLPLHVHYRSGKSHFGFLTLLKAMIHLGCSHWLQTSQDVHKAWSSTEKMHHPRVWKLHICILREPDQLQCSVMLTHYTTYSETLGRASPGHSAQYHTAAWYACAVWWTQNGNLNSQRIAKVAVISLPFLFSVLLNPDLDSLGWKWSYLCL